jgi:hypothetical protein
LSLWGSRDTMMAGRDAWQADEMETLWLSLAQGGERKI